MGRRLLSFTHFKATSEHHLAFHLFKSVNSFDLYLLLLKNDSPEGG